MTNIPKKLDEQKQPWYDKTLANKINELIDYLQANKPVGCCCIKKHSTGEVSKKDKYLCYTCNQWGIVGEHECEASKGERESIECLKEKVKKNIIDHSHAVYEKLDPPEHEEDFDRLAQGLRNHVIDDVRFSGLFEYVKDYIRDNFEPKRKKHE